MRRVFLRDRRHHARRRRAWFQRLRRVRSLFFFFFFFFFARCCCRCCSFLPSFRWHFSTTHSVRCVVVVVVKLFFFPNERRAPQDARPESARAKKTLLTVARKICQQTAPKSFKSLLKGCAVHNSSRDQKTTKNLVRLFDFFQEKSIGHRAKREIIFPRERERHTHTQTNT